MDEAANITPMDNDAEPVAPLRRSGSRRRQRNGADARQRRRRVATYVALAVSACFMVNALVGDKGLLGRMKARSSYDATQSAINRLRYDNARLQEQARRLRDDPTAIEERARRDLDLIRPGETLVILKDAKPADLREP